MLIHNNNLLYEFITLRTITSIFEVFVILKFPKVLKTAAYFAIFDSISILTQTKKR